MRSQTATNPSSASWGARPEQLRLGCAARRSSGHLSHRGLPPFRPAACLRGEGVRSQPAPTRARPEQPPAPHLPPIADWPREQHAEPNCYPPVSSEPDCLAGADPVRTVAPTHRPPTRSFSGGSAIVACHLPPRRSAPRKLLAELLPPALDHHLLAGRTLPSHRAGVSRRETPAGLAAVLRSSRRPTPIARPPARSGFPPTGPALPLYSEPFPHPPARELPAPGSGGGGADAGRGFR